MGHKSKNSTLTISPLGVHPAVQQNYQNQCPSSQAIHHQQFHHFGGISGLGTQSHNSNNNLNNSSSNIQSPAQMSSSVVGSLLSPNQSSSNQVTSSFSEYRFKPEVVTTSNRIQESCI